MIPDTAIRNDAGDVAIKWVLNRPAQTIQIQGTDRYYVPRYAHNVAMLWIREQDAERVLGFKEKTCNCANGIFQNAFVLANQIDINLHKCGNRTCDD